MYCPLCKSEYRPEIKICSDCHVTLVDALPVEQKLTEITWANAGILPGKIYAEMVAEILNKEGIPHFINSDVLTSTFNISGLGSTGGEVKLFVPEENLETAQQLISEIVQ